MLVSKKAMTMPPCKVTALFEIMQYGVHRTLTFGLASSLVESQKLVRAKPPMLVSKQVMTMPLRKVNALLEYMQYGVHRILTV